MPSSSSTTLLSQGKIFQENTDILFFLRFLLYSLYLDTLNYVNPTGRQTYSSIRESPFDGNPANILASDPNGNIY